ncbi:MAG: competence protein ComEC [Halieaceae bacterium]
MRLAPERMALVVLITAAVLLLLPVLPPAWMAVLPLLLVFLWPRRKVIEMLCICALVAFLLLRQAHAWQDALLPARCEGVPITLLGQVEGLVAPVSDAIAAPSGADRPAQLPLYRFSLSVQQLHPAACRGPARVSLYWRGDRSPRPGERFSAEVRLRQPWGYSNPYAGSNRRQAFLRGEHARGSARSLQPLGEARRLPVAARVARLRGELSLALREAVPGDIGALLAGLAVGDQRFIPSWGWERLRRYGLTHLLVISGMHVSLLAALGWYAGCLIIRLETFTGPATALRLLPFCLSFLCALYYSALSGFTLPTQRALLMLGLAMLPAAAGRKVPVGQLLAAVFMVLVLLDPRCVLDESLWLSLGAVCLLVWAAGWARNQGYLLRLASLQGYMLVAVLPLSLYCFHEGAGVWGLLNLVAIPWITLLIAPCALLGVLLWSLWPSLAVLVWQCAAGLLGPLWWGMEYWEGVPSALGGVQAIAILASLIPALLAALLLALPGGYRSVLSALLLFLPLMFAKAPASGNELRVLFFDVGQGTAVLLEHAGQTLLYDTGGGPPAGPPIARRTITPYLTARGADRIDQLVVSHDDHDHNAGVDYLQKRFDIPVLREAVGGFEGGIRPCRLGEKQRFGSAVLLEFLSQALPGDSDNNSSCVLLVSAYGRHFLLPGDIDQRRERELLVYWGSRLKVDVLLAAHHGSASSSSRLWLRSLDPAWVVISAGRANRFGHPAHSVQSAVRASGARLLNTSARGALEFRVTADGRLHCRSYRHRYQPFWRRGDFGANCAAH